MVFQKTMRIEIEQDAINNMFNHCYFYTSASDSYKQLMVTFVKYLEPKFLKE